MYLSSDSFSRSTALVFAVWILCSGSEILAQTPWVSAPATPAQLPARQPGISKRVVSLPPPPARTAAPGQGLPAGQPPVAVSAQSYPYPGQQAYPSQRAAFSPPNSGPAAGPSIQLPPVPTASELPPVSPARMGLSGAAPNVPPAPQGSLVSYDTQAPQPAESQHFQPGELVAVVGTDHILAGDMMVFVEPIIEENRSRLTDTQADMLRARLTRQVLKQYVEIKALYQEFFRDMVGTAPPDEIEEMRKQVVTRAGKIFFDKQVPSLMKKYEVNDVRELEVKLQAKSMSLRTLRSQFIEQVLSQELERKYVPDEFEIGRDELLAHYREHRDDWKVPARARWRQLTIRFDKHDGVETAERLIKNLGNQVFLGGKPFEAVARDSSEGYTADEGGVYDWTTQGSLKSKPLDQALFSLEPRRMSKVIRDDVGFHIIEVLEREDGHSKDFTVAQVEIRATLSKQKRSEAVKEFRAEVMSRTPVWTRWPEDVPGSRPLSDAIGDINS